MGFFSVWGWMTDSSNTDGCPDRVDIVKDMNNNSKEPCGGEKYYYNQNWLA